MKITIGLLLFLVNINASIAQIPDYFGNNPAWIIREGQTGFWGNGCWSVDDYLYYADGDTTIGSYTYKKIKRKGWTWFDGVTCWTGVDTYYDNGYSFGFRQDGRKIYINESGQDSLYVDYNLSIGDTLSTCYILPYQPNFDVIVQSIDSILLSSGYHLIYEFYNTEFDTVPFYLYEGIGIFSTTGQSGLFNLEAMTYPAFEWRQYMKCYFQNGINEIDLGGAGFLPCDLSLFDFTVGAEELPIPIPTKQLIKVCDVLGRETPQRSGIPLMYYYSDGTIKRKFVID